MYVTQIALEKLTWLPYIEVKHCSLWQIDGTHKLKARKQRYPRSHLGLINKLSLTFN